MTDEKKEDPKNDYSTKIGGLLSKVTKGEVKQQEVSVVATPSAKIEPTTYEKMKAMEGGIKAGIKELFKIEESAFDIPHYLTEEDNDQIVGTSLFRVKPPSNHPDADSYWDRISPFLKRIGKVVPHIGEGPGSLDISLVTDKGKEEILRIQLVRDESNGDKPTITFEFLNGEELTADEVFKIIGRIGLKADRINAKQLQGMIILDVVEQ